jgi:hypothetical protein
MEYKRPSVEIDRVAGRVEAICGYRHDDFTIGGSVVEKPFDLRFNAVLVWEPSTAATTMA